MTEKQIKQRIKVIKDQLKLAGLYEEEFSGKLGKKQYQAFINNNLDELRFLLDLLTKL